MMPLKDGYESSTQVPRVMPCFGPPAYQAPFGERFTQVIRVGSGGDRTQITALCMAIDRPGSETCPGVAGGRLESPLSGQSR
jgi:hypothetical protein